MRARAFARLLLELTIAATSLPAVLCLGGLQLLPEFMSSFGAPSLQSKCFVVIGRAIFVIDLSLSVPLQLFQWLWGLIWATSAHIQMGVA